MLYTTPWWAVGGAMDLRDIHDFKDALTRGFRVLDTVIGDAGRKPRVWGEHMCQLSQFSMAVRNGTTWAPSHPLDRPRLRKANGGELHYDSA